MFMQRYIEHLPSAGEIVIFDRSWYNRAGVESVMGFSTDKQVKRFLELCPRLEQYIIQSGIQLIKFWLEANMEEQEKRFLARVEDPLRQWKLSPMDIESYDRWYQYSKARDRMLEATDTDTSPWHIVRTEDKRRGRLNLISHLLKLIPYEQIKREKIKLPKRSDKGKYDDVSTLEGRRFVPELF
jgi:polyphosphate kinase 2 (PPK2 family)